MRDTEYATLVRESMLPIAAMLIQAIISQMREYDSEAVAEHPDSLTPWQRYTARMPSRSACAWLAVILVGAWGVSVTAADPAVWSRFRGPNGSGVSAATNVPIEFGPSKNLLWRLALPRGHSAPILHGDRIYLTAFRDAALLTIAIDRNAGRILWERPAPPVTTKVVDKRNNPASPSPAVDDTGVYVFF